MFKRDKRSEYEKLELTFKALVPVPDKQMELIGELEKGTEPKKTGWFSKAFYMSHEGADGSEGKIRTWGRKPPFQSWSVNVSEGVDGKIITKTIKLDGKVNTEGAVAEAAGRISDSVTDLAQKLIQAQKFKLHAADAIEYKFGNKKIGIHSGSTEEKIPKKPEHDQMVIAGSITMPASFNFLFRDIRDYIAVEAGMGSKSFIVTIDGDDKEKDDVILVERLSGGGDWKASGMNGFEYDKNFGGLFGGLSPDQMKDRIAFDLAVANFGKRGFIEHISNYPVKDRQVLEIKTAYGSYDQKALEAEAFEQG